MGSPGIPLAPWASAVGLVPATGFAGLPGLRGRRQLDPDACSPSGQCLPAQRPEAPQRPAQPHRGGTERQAAQTPAGTERHEAAMLEPAWGVSKTVSAVHTPGQMGRARGSQRAWRPRLPEGREGPRTGDPRVTLCCGPAQESPGSQAQKRPRPSAKASILAEAKGSVSASDQSPSIPQGSCQLSAPSISLKEAANVVVKCLTPFYKEGKFASKVW